MAGKWNIDQNVWIKLADNLNEYGFITDEDEAWLSRSGISQHKTEIEKYLRDAGYNGGDLAAHSFDNEGEGWLVLLYDQEKFFSPFEVQVAWRDKWKQKIELEVKDWMNRLGAIVSQIREWTKDLNGLRIEELPPMMMHEQLMRKFGVSPVEMPRFQILHGDKRVLRFEPKGLWVIGSNGRIDLVTRASSYILVDNSESMSEQSQWTILHSDKRLKNTVFDKPAFDELLDESLSV